MLRREWLWSVCVLGAFACGCGGGDGVATVEVSGEVKIGGKTLEGVEVHFAHEKFKGFGLTDATGKFKLKAVPGPNKVYFSKIEGAGTAESGMDAGQLAAAAGATFDPSSAAPPQIKGQLVPEKYTRFETTDKQFDVPAGGSTSANFDVQ